MISAPLRAPAIRLGAALMLCGSLALSGCGGSEEAPASFPPPDYSYLPKLRMNVATLTVVDHVQQAGPEPGDIAQTAPVPPDQALQRLAQDRLVAAGNSGSAVFTIDRASIVQGSTGALDGHLAVHLDIITANGGHAGYAEAHVSRQLVPGDPDAAGGTRRQLYDLDRQMMQDMNVELEFQVRRSLRDWLVDAGGAPLAGSVEQQSLPPPGSPGYPAPAGTSYPGAPVGTSYPGAPAGTSYPGAPAGTSYPGAPVGMSYPGAPVGTSYPGAPVGTTPIGAVPVQSNGPVVLAPPGSALPPPVPPATATVPPDGTAPAMSAPDPVFPDGAPSGNSLAPAPAMPRSPPPSFLQAPPSTAPTPYPAPYPAQGATPPGY
ncbi:hypothetical protein [Lichenicoccus roseus]|nr:hypothetical protein [Lichenicoccus roseus]